MSTSDYRYATTVTVTGGREGHAVSDDGALDISLRPPKLRGTPDGTNPEQLFAAAWGGCFQSALLAVARAQGIDASASTVQVEVSVGADDTGGYGLTARIDVQMPGVAPEAARQITDLAHAGCPYSRATQGNMPVEVNVTGWE